MESEMDAREGKPAVAHAAKREYDEAAERLLSSVVNYTMFLYVGTIVSSLASRVALKYAPDAVASARRFLACGYDISVAAAFFAGTTLFLQAHLARVLRPSTGSTPRVRLTPLFAWPLAVVTWFCMTSFFVSCLAFGDDDVGGYEWAVAAGASVANLVMATRTVKRHLG